VEVHAVRDPELPTGTCVVLVEPGGERTMAPDPGANAALAPADLPAALFATRRHLHLTGYTLLRPGSRAAGLAALALAREHGLTISVDPSSAGPLAAAGAAAFLPWIRGADLLLPNAAEAAVLTGEDDAERAALALTGHAREVVVTLGDRGALWTDGERLEHAPAIPTEGADTTGAGDAFAAGMLAAWRAGGDARAALEAGCALAARAVAVAGARPGTAVRWSG
jgi:ribokinase